MRCINDYEVNIKKTTIDENYSEFVATFKQFPDIVGVGDTREEALEEATANLNLYFDYCDDNGVEIPEPILEEDNSSFSGKITLRISKQLHKDLFDYSNEDGMSLNSIINDAIRCYLLKQSVQKVKYEAINCLKSISQDLVENQTICNISESLWKKGPWDEKIN